MERLTGEFSKGKAVAETGQEITSGLQAATDSDMNAHG
jgi:hypothetical protein